MAPRKLKSVPSLADEDLLPGEPVLPEARPEELPPETGTAVAKGLVVRYTVVRAGEEGTMEVDLLGGGSATVPYRAGDILLAEGDVVTPVNPTWFNRHYRVVQGEDSESAYEERFPKFSTGGTAYVRVVCPDCDQTMIFTVQVGEIRTSGDKSTLKPTFKATAKEHHCGQISAKLEDHEDDGLPAADRRDGAAGTAGADGDEAGDRDPEDDDADDD